MTKDLDVINAFSNNLFRFIDSIASGLVDKLGWSKSTVLSHFENSDFVCILIAIIEKKGKEQAKKNSDLEAIKANSEIQERVDRINDIKAPLADRDAPAQAD